MNILVRQGVSALMEWYYMRGSACDQWIVKVIISTVLGVRELLHMYT